MCRAQDGILKYMLKMMEVCNAQGFVYGIIPENGKPVSGASDNLRPWWKEKVRFYKNGPAAIAKHLADHSPKSLTPVVVVSTPHTLQELQDTTLGCHPEGGGGDCYPISDAGDYDVETAADESIINSVQVARVKRDLVDSINSEKFKLKRKQQSNDTNHHHLPPVFPAISAKNNHLMSGTYRPIASGNRNFQMNNIEKVPVFGMPSFGQTKLAAAPPPPYGGGGGVSELRLPGDGQNMISDLMEFYETNLQQTTGSFNFENVDPIQVDCGFIGENSGFDSGSNMNVNDNNTLDFRFGEQSSFTQNASMW
ncbi:hypothetical protein L2E82_11150 [Cichorium intybus]|uniref:Uncharacterized protein n=1 Tax=Cichorium intybus TaxID=13427 RepID=A0ACB9GCD4_CICIN|nr:hypothetical protein L2E82_11150 [Cichorium intybus]